MNSTERLNSREQAAYSIIVRAATDSLPTPRHSDIVNALRLAGHKSTISNIGNIVAKLRLVGLIDIAWIGDLTSQARIYQIPGTKLETLPRSAAGVGAAPWPYPATSGHAAYDAAVASREFGKPEHRSGEKPMPITGVRRSYGVRSLTGCSAAMAAS